jgi:large subunit ribosomal protein L33
MAKVKYSDNLITLKCSNCKRRNYYSRKNRRKVERKIELKKYCRWCRKSTLHKEGRISGK